MTENRGIPISVLQTKLQNSQLADEQDNTVKVAILEVDSTIGNLIAVYFCYSKSVSFLSSSIIEIKWNAFSKKSLR